MKRLRWTLRNFFQKRKLESDLDEELQFHLDMQIRQNLEKGMSEDEARRAAQMTLGGLQQVKENCRDVRAGAFFDVLMQDLRYAIRSLLRSPGFLIVVLLTLALSIGANTAIFTVAKAVLLRPLPYPDSERIAMIWLREKDGSLSNTNYATYKDWKERLRSFESIAVMSSWEPTLQGHGEPTPLEGLSVSREFFSVLGVGPFLGRNFLDYEDRPDHNRVVILTHNFWQHRLGGDRSIIGKQIHLSGIPRTVVGILPPNFESIMRYNLREAEIFRPLGYNETLPQACRTCNHLTAIGRIRSRVPFEQAAREIDSFTASLVKQYPHDYGTAGATLVPLMEQVVSQARKILLLLLAAVAIVMLVACANVANLMMARASRRGHEMAIRRALGASRLRLMRQLLTESALLALAGGVLGFAVANWGTDILLRHAPATIPRLQTVSVDGMVLLFALGISILSGLLFGLVPAFHGSGLHLQGSLQESGRSVSMSRQRFRKALVVGNVALALILLSGAALFFQSIRQLLSQRLGFDKENVITMAINLTGMKYDKPEVVDVYYRQVLEHIRALPGVESAGLVSQLPLSTSLDMYGVHLRDKPLANRGEAPSAERFAITPGYLDALKIPILRGRGITAQDRADSQPVVLINRTFARRLWAGEDPIGKQIHIGEPERPWRTVVGVVEDVRHRGLDEPIALQFYMPFQQWFDSSLTVVARTTNDPSAGVHNIRKAIWSVDPNQPISQVATMNQVIEATIAQKRYALQLIESFAIAALFLAAIGVYGIMAYSVNARYQEIGLRMALGANRFNVLSLILRSGLGLTLAGIAIGIAGSVLVLRFAQELLFQVRSTDPWILSTSVVILLAVALVACIVPAIRAARLNPTVALRHE